MGLNRTMLDDTGLLTILDFTGQYRSIHDYNGPYPTTPDYNGLYRTILD